MTGRGPLIVAGVLCAVGLVACAPATPLPTHDAVPVTAPAMPVAVATPTAVRIPAIGASSSLVATGLTDTGALAVPPVEQPEQASWWDGSPEPGALGPAVLLGHVDGGGRPGVFARLAELSAGDEVLVDRADGSTARFVVDEVVEVAKLDFPTRSVYGDTAGPELRLITCGGDFNPALRSYEGQVIAFARLADGPTP